MTSDVREAILGSEISLICVGTPSAPNGSQDQTAMLRLAHDIGQVMRDKAAPHVFVFRSTLVPGTVEDVLRPIVERESGKKDGVDFHLCFQPEFLREGSSIRDYDKPPFTIVGAGVAALRSSAAAAVRAPAVRVPFDVDSRRGDGQVLLQQFPRAQDHVRQRDRPACARRWASILSRSWTWSARTASSTSRRPI